MNINLIFSIILHLSLTIFLYQSETIINSNQRFKQSIPVNITKLSEITQGSKLGGVGIIDEKFDVTVEDKEFVPIASKENINAEKQNSPDPNPKVSIQEKTLDYKISTKEKGQEKSKSTNKSAKPSKQTETNKPALQKKDKKQNKKKEENGIDSLISKITQTNKTTNKSGGAQALGELSASHFMAIKEMIRPCWSIIDLPRNSEITVKMEVNLSKNGYVMDTKVLNPKWSDPVFKHIANSATRALSDKRCQPFKLPSKQYSQWKKIIMNFCPAKF